MFGALPSPHNSEEYANLVTEMYAETAEVLKDIAIIKPAGQLEADLTDRMSWLSVEG